MDDKQKTGNHPDKYTYMSLDGAKAEARLTCANVHEEIWVMRQANGRYSVIRPYSEEVKKHYLEKLRWERVVSFEPKLLVREVGLLAGPHRPRAKAGMVREAPAEPANQLRRRR